MAITNYILLTVTTFLISFTSALPEQGLNRDLSCPYPSELTTYYPNPSNCSEFFECYEGRKYKLSCNEHLFWNQAKLQCDYLQNVDCNREDILCSDKPNGSYVANPSDCSKFYECIDHKALGGRCPPGTFWNQQIIGCDYPQNVKC